MPPAKREKYTKIRVVYSSFPYIFPFKQGASHIGLTSITLAFIGQKWKLRKVIFLHMLKLADSALSRDHGSTCHLVTWPQKTLNSSSGLDFQTLFLFRFWISIKNAIQRYIIWPYLLQFIFPSPYDIIMTKLMTSHKIGQWEDFEFDENAKPSTY